VVRLSHEKAVEAVKGSMAIHFYAGELLGFLLPP